MLEQGKPLSLEATGVDPESGIKEVIFYLGKPVDGKMPPNATKVDGRFDAKRTSWSGVLAVPADKVGTIDVTAQFTNGVGQSIPESISVQITPPTKPGAPGKASISGKVVEGEYAQAGIPITLADLKGGEPQEAKTNDKGEFTFGDLAPGKYRITAVRSASRTRGQSDTIQVKEGEKKTGVTIKLYRR